jgi:hypothetical protein
VHGDRHRRRLGIAGHAGLSADHEFHRATALLLFERGFAFGVATDFAVLGLLAAILLGIGAYLFSKIEA